MPKKVIVVGGVAGGASAAARLRRLDEQAEIILLERDEYISFANCGLPYYIGDIIEEREKLIVKTPESMRSRYRIDVRVHSEAVGVDVDRKVVRIQSGEKGLYEETYDYLILSPGVKAVRPNIEGIDHPRILTLKTLPDADQLKAYVDKEEVKRAVVVGGGYIGLEAAENLRKRGLMVTIVEAAPHILAPLDTDMSTIVEKEILDNDLDLILDDGVKAFQDQNGGVDVILNSGKKISGDLVILAIGVTPETDFLRGSKISLGPKGHIVVNEKLETTAAQVYAVGDAIEIVDFVTKQKGAIPLAGPANKQGRIAADNVAGLNSAYHGTQGTAVIRVFGLTAANTGSNARTLKNLQIPYHEITTHGESHASFYPGGEPLTIKLLFSPEGKVLGAQGVGRAGVDKRIDVIATVIRLGGTVTDLAELELCYAPPFSSAKDPVNIAGYVAQNVLAGRVNPITLEQLSASVSSDQESIALVDFRTEEEFKDSHFAGAKNLPLDSLRERIEELDKDKDILGYCQAGMRGYVSSRILSQKGFKVKNLSGGYKAALTLPEKPAIVEDKH